MKSSIFPLTLLSVLTVLASFFLSSCGDGDGSVITNSSKISSATLNARTRRAATDCDGNQNPASCTPSNLEGRIFAMGASLGGGEGQSGGYSMTFMAGNENVINDPSDTSHSEGTKTFNLATPVTVSGLISIPSEDNMPSNPVISKFESYFDYIDATFTLSNTTGIDASYTVRFVFRVTAEADDVDDTMQVGDKLLLNSSTNKFEWCTSSACGQTTRPSSPLQQASIINDRQTAITQGLQGNQNYALYTVNIPSASQLTVTHAQIADTTRLWTVDFDVSTALAFGSNISDLSTTKDMVDAVSLVMDSESNPISGTLTIGDAGSAS